MNWLSGRPGVARDISRQVRAVGIIGGVLFVGGCAAQSAPVTLPESQQGAGPSAEWAAWRPAVTVPPVKLTEAEAQARRETYLRAMADQTQQRYPQVKIDEFPALVRWISPDEVGPVLADCLTGAGFPATSADDRRGYGVDSQAGQESALALAEFECFAQFTVDARVLGEVPSGWKEVLWEYSSEFLVPCMAERGYEPEEPLPTREVYIRDMGWEAHPPTLTADQRNELSVACPASPPFAALTGE